MKRSEIEYELEELAKRSDELFDKAFNEQISIPNIIEDLRIISIASSALIRDLESVLKEKENNKTRSPQDAA